MPTQPPIAGRPTPANSDPDADTTDDLTAYADRVLSGTGLTHATVMHHLAATPPGSDPTAELDTDRPAATPGHVAPSLAAGTAALSALTDGWCSATTRPPVMTESEPPA